MIPVVSFPKSGRTWLRYAAHRAGLEPEFTHAGHPSCPPEEIGLPFKGIPDDLKDTPVIFLHRNPIDTAVSYYFQLFHKDLIVGRKNWRKLYQMDPDRMPPQDINQFVLHPNYGIKLILDYNRAWVDHLETVPNAVVLCYEDFHADPVGSFRKFFTALGHPEVDAARIARRSTFENMKKIQAGSKGHSWRLVQPFKDDPEGAKVRKGKVKGYVDYLDRRTAKECRKFCGKYGIKA